MKITLSSSTFGVPIEVGVRIGATNLNISNESIPKLIALAFRPQT